MKALGSIMRYLLNINTVWGLMIVVSFVACVVQHYRPTTTLLPAAALQPSANTLTLKITGLDEKTETFNYSLALAANGLVLPEDDPAGRKTRPYFLRAHSADGGHELTWDSDRHGRYEIIVNGKAVGRGRLVTLAALTEAATEYASRALEIALKLVGTMVLFLGLMKVGEDAGIVQLAARVFHPVIRFLFPQVPREHPANGAILMNITTSILGLGNAATPFGLKAMKELQSLNPHADIATDAQVTLLAYNTAGLALIPTSLLAIRQASGCSDPFEIIGTCLLAGATSTIVALTLSRLLGRLPLFSVRAALAEAAAESGLPAGEPNKAAAHQAVVGADSDHEEEK